MGLEAELVIDAGTDAWPPAGRCCGGQQSGVHWSPWLDVFCPGCGTNRAIDLRTLDRHPLASVGTLVLGLRRS
jgi:hypothetical protein